jgi:hypothetical protein
MLLMRMLCCCLQLDVKLTGASWGGGAGGEPVSCLLVPPLLTLKSHASPGTRAQALAVTTLMTGHMPLGLQNNVQLYIQVGGMLLQRGSRRNVVSFLLHCEREQGPHAQLLKEGVHARLSNVIR